jgi:uncharacterized membrane protein
MRNETGRTEALSDGIFAIAMTLLVLEIRVPDVASSQSLVRAMLHDWPAYLAFLIGFFTLLVCWINHHYMFELIERHNGVLLLLNGCKLVVVSFTPFATAVLSTYIDTGLRQIAVTVYALNFFLMGLSMTSLWCYAARRGFVAEMPARVLGLTTRLYIFASILSGAILVVSFVSVWAALALFVVMFGVFVFPRDLVRTLVRQEQSSVRAFLAGRVRTTP